VDISGRIGYIGENEAEPFYFVDDTTMALSLPSPNEVQVVSLERRNHLVATNLEMWLAYSVRNHQQR